MKKIYGNENLLNILNSMIKLERPANSVIFQGEKGCGKKLFADYYTAQLLCRNTENGKPCGICSSCRNVMNHTHPDVTYAETSGKTGGYSVKTARETVADAFIMPNNQSNRKVYIFSDCRNMSEQTQNIMLKIIEEPPPYAFFIFTAESEYEFLPTIISRCMTFRISPCTEIQAVQALHDEGFSENEIQQAVSAFHGNIGMCKEFTEDENLKKKVDLTKKLSESIIRNDEYSFNVSLFSVGTERNDIFAILSLMESLFRDSAVFAYNPDSTALSCFPEGAVRLSQRITPYQSAEIHRIIEKTWLRIKSNVSVQLALSAMGAEIFSIIN